MQWFIQNNPAVQRMAAPMAQAVLRAGCALRDFSMSPVPRKDAAGQEALFWRVPEAVLDEMEEMARKEEPWFFYGSAGALSNIREREALRLWIRFDETAFCVASWKERLGDRWLNAAGQEATLGDLAAGLDLPWGGRFFIRPLVSDKWFSGQAIDTAAAQSLADRLLSEGASTSARVWVNGPLAIQSEWRFAVVDGQPVSAGGYRHESRARLSSDAPPEAWSMAQWICDNALPSSACAVDVYRLETGEMGAVEFNGIHTAGWYALNRDALVSAIERSPILNARVSSLAKSPSALASFKRSQGI